MAATFISVGQNSTISGAAVLVICNGVMKGGSTWVVKIIQQFGNFQKIPSRHQNTEWHNSSFRADDLERLKTINFYRDGDYYCKQHFHRRRHITATQDPDVKIINIVRDLRDMVISWAFHQKRHAQIPNDWDISDIFNAGLVESWLEDVIRHQRNWHGAGAANVPHLMSYERLHVDFDASLRDLVQFLDHPDLPYSKELSRKIFRATNQRQNAVGDPSKHVRTGLVGDYQNHMTEEQEECVSQLAKQFGYDDIKDQMRRDFPELEPYLQFTDIGLPGRAPRRGAAE